MFAKTLTLTAAFALLAGAAFATETTHTVQMLNKGEAGAMVFEPAYIAAQPGDTITFVPTDGGHNAATLKDLIPEGAEAFKGDMGQEISITVTKEGLYGVECTPHAGMGMVALIQVGEATNLEAATAVGESLRGKAKDRFQEALAQVQ
ncbi:pseudoazurin [Rubellimicrobium roseum]|uniref:Pseudoazurin n=1 Tax=Rubellimicrobium roseum TaxID=687525 RepID=A0A5C4NGT3_9RHOB|nr:pseudoazurin [Rubellimicrobium roseum]TNC73282.1 pseudoazurin [Rubellimicrobium roseum]